MVLVCLVAVAAAFHLIMAWWPGDQKWVSGLVTGSLLAIWVIARQSPPTAIEHWQGGVGEELAASELAKLDPAE